MPMTWMRPEEGRPYDIISLIVAVILFVSPWAFGYTQDSAAAWASWILAILMGASAIIASSRYTRIFREVNLVLGIITAAAPWIFQFQSDTNASTVHLILGLLVAIVSAAELMLWRGPTPQLRL